MKLKLSILFCIMVLTTASVPSYAGFVVKRQAFTTDSVAAVNSNELTTQHMTFREKMGALRKVSLSQPDRSFIVVKQNYSAAHIERVNSVNTIVDLLQAHDGTSPKAKQKDHNAWKGWEGTTSLILGILAMCMFFPFLPAIILGAIGMQKGRKHRGRAIAGFIMGIVAPVLWIAIFIMFLIIVG